MKPPSLPFVKPNAPQEQQQNSSANAEKDHRDQDVNAVQYDQTEEDVDPKLPLPDFDWEQLEVKYEEDMLAKIREEEQLHTEFDNLMKV